MKVRNLQVLLLIAFINSGCAYTYLNKETKDLLIQRNVNLTNVQFYIDRDVKLQRQYISEEDQRIRSGRVVIKTGEEQDNIFLRKNTPGVLRSLGGDIIRVSFEPSDTEGLIFCETEAGRYYQIGARNWGGGQIRNASNNNGINRLLSGKNITGSIGEITYNGETYSITPGNARIKIRKSVTNKLKIKKRTMKGQKVD